MFIVFDYEYNELRNDLPLNIKKKFIKININCFDEFYELRGFIVMPSFNHFTALLVSDLKANNTLDYFCYDGLNRGGIVLNN